jgi:hypothetical protein
MPRPTLKEMQLLMDLLTEVDNITGINAINLGPGTFPHQKKEKTSFKPKEPVMTAQPSNLNLERLIKLMKLAASPSANPNEAWLAFTRANEMLLSQKWDWEKLLRGKISLVADPFGPAMPAPMPTPHHSSAATWSPPKRPAPAAPTRQFVCEDCYNSINANHLYQHQGKDLCVTCYTRATTNAKRPGPPKGSQRTNRYSDFCFCCGDPVDANKGLLHRPPNYSGWATLCTKCDNLSKQPNFAWPTRRAKRQRVSTTNLMSGLGP